MIHLELTVLPFHIMMKIVALCDTLVFLHRDGTTKLNLGRLGIKFTDIGGPTMLASIVEENF